jgi:hypothetical protein
MWRSRSALDGWKALGSGWKYKWVLGGAEFVARRCCGTGLKALAVAAGGLDYGSMAAALQRFRKKLETDPFLRDSYERITARLSK